MVAIFISLNFLSNAVEAQYGQQEPPPVFDMLDFFFNVIFTCELLVNLYANWFRNFWGDHWNTFDFIVVVSSLAGNVLPNITPLRLLRAFRVLRVFKRLQSLRQVLNALQQSIPGVRNAFLIVVLCMGIYAILGVQLFAQYDELHFGNFSRAMMSLFQIMSGDGWMSDIGGALVEYTGLASLYFVSFYILSAIILTNIIIAVLLDKFVSPEMDNKSEEELQLDAMLEVLSEDPELVAQAKADLDDADRDYLESKHFQSACFAVFDEADVDHSGSLSVEEMVEKSIVAELLPKRYEKAVTEAHIKGFIDHVDNSKDGELDRDEFIEFCKFLNYATRAVKKRKKKKKKPVTLEQVSEHQNSEMHHMKLMLHNLEAKMERLEQILVALGKDSKSGAEISEIMRKDLPMNGARHNAMQTADGGIRPFSRSLSMPIDSPRSWTDADDEEEGEEWGPLSRIEKDGDDNSRRSWLDSGEKDLEDLESTSSKRIAEQFGPGNSGTIVMSPMEPARAEIDLSIKLPKGRSPSANVATDML